MFTVSTRIEETLLANMYWNHVRQISVACKRERAESPEKLLRIKDECDTVGDDFLRNLNLFDMKHVRESRLSDIDALL